MKRGLFKLLSLNKKRIINRIIKIKLNDMKKQKDYKIFYNRLIKRYDFLLYMYNKKISFFFNIVKK